VETEGRKEADDSVRHALRGFGQGVVLGETILSTAVQSSSHSDKKTLTMQTSHMLAGDAIRPEFPRAEDADPSHDLQGLLGFRRLHAF
jgi:hypothetical protein